MNLLLTILIGLAIGLLVEVILPGHDPVELVLACLLGVSGALIARLLGAAAGWYAPDEPLTFVASVLGAVIVLMIYGLLFRKRRRESLSRGSGSSLF